jgi:para-nitrobenzyl esterase
MSRGEVRTRLFIAACMAAFCLASATASAVGVVPTDKGPVRGNETAAMKQYLGIPYAAPPVGDLRWRPPQAPARWQGPRDATQFGNHCPQTASPFGRESTTEDCLYLNVFTPNRGPGRGHTKNLPVMVWIHGGALVVGESDDYDPTRLVQHGAIVVTLNYRLGHLGFLAHPALSAESPDHASGDYGLMDQQAALRWVQRNIAKFGGNPDNVTIFGQSAGGLSVHSQLASPLAAGLFDRAIAQSGAYATSLPSLTTAEGAGTVVADGSGCGDQTAACMRGIPVETLLAHQPATAGSLVPNIDGNVLPLSINEALDSGQFNRVPVVEGSTHDEFSIFAYTNVEAVFGQFPASFYPIVVPILLSTLGSNANPSAVIAQYPITSYQQSVGRALTAIGTDMLFACPGRRTAQALSKFVPTYAYEFNDPDAPQLFVPPASFPYKAYHASEIQYLFDIPNQTGAPPLNADQQQLANAMTRYWTRFADTGTPNGSGTPNWPAYTSANDLYMSLQPPTPTVTSGFAADHKCAFWDAQ